MKQKLVAAFIAQLENDLISMKEAARATHEAATHEESKAENEYDTRGLEASYLAGAQAKRAAEIDEVLALFRNLPFKEFAPDDVIQSTALVDVRIDGRAAKLLLMPKGGAVRLNFEGQTIQIVTPQSSLGGTLIGMRAGEVTEFEVGENSRECEVVTVQ
jgi:hypothetical protein